MTHIAITPTKEYTNLKCEDCIHFWKRSYEIAKCTSEKNTFIYGKNRKIKDFMPCDYYEE